jgi:hypothetical protein
MGPRSQGTGVDAQDRCGPVLFDRSHLHHVVETGIVQPFMYFQKCHFEDPGKFFDILNESGAERGLMFFRNYRGFKGGARGKGTENDGTIDFHNHGGGIPATLPEACRS